MISLTAINGTTFYLNSELIYRMESAPDTILTMVDGKTIIVTETPEVVAHKVIEYKRLIFQPDLFTIEGTKD